MKTAETAESREPKFRRIFRRSEADARLSPSCFSCHLPPMPQDDVRELLVWKKQSELRAQPPIGTTLGFFCVIASTNLELHRLMTEFHHLLKS